jgi:hypothetical protein
MDVELFSIDTFHCGYFIAEIDHVLHCKTIEAGVLDDVGF